MSNIKLFESKHIRSIWDDKAQRWLFAVVDVVAALTDSQNPQVYWRVLKKRLLAEGNESVTNCNALKMTAPDGKQRLTDVADTEQLFRLIQSIPSPKAEPFKRWLAQVGYERLEEIENPELAQRRTAVSISFVIPAKAGIQEHTRHGKTTCRIHTRQQAQRYTLHWCYLRSGQAYMGAQAGRGGRSISARPLVSTIQTVTSLVFTKKSGT